MLTKAQAEQLGGAMLAGFFDVVGALGSTLREPAGGEGAQLTGNDLEAFFAAPAVAATGIIPGYGAVGVVLPESACVTLLSEVAGLPEPEDEAQADAYWASAKDLLDPCLGGGAGKLKEVAKTELSLNDIAVWRASTDGFGGVMGVLGEYAWQLPFTFTQGGLMKEGAVLIGAGLEKLVAPAPEAPAPAAGGEEQEAAAEPMFAGGGQARPSAGSSAAAGGADMGQEAAADTEDRARGALNNLDLILDIRLVATARLGSVEMPLQDILTLGPGSILEVGHSVDEPVELYVNDKLIARGDVVVVDERFGLRITEIVSTQERIESLR